MLPAIAGVKGTHCHTQLFSVDMEPCKLVFFFFFLLDWLQTAILLISAT
jgi:hypothetical protein